MFRRRSKAARRVLARLFLALMAACGLWVGWSWPRGPRPADPIVLTSVVAETPPTDRARPAVRPAAPSSALVRLVAPTAASRPADNETTATPGPSSPVQDMGDPRATDSQPAPPPAAPAPTASRPADPVAAQTDLKAGLAALERGALLEARSRLNEALRTGLPPAEAAQARQALSAIAADTLFNTAVLPDDPLAAHYTVKSGDTLGRIAARFKVTEEMLATINRLPNRNFIREGRRLKVLRGPFHATVCKSDHTLHAFLQDVYVGSFRVALGANGGTPTGRWKVINRQPNPGWTDPRTGREWHPDDPANPIGEFWIGLEGVEGQAVGAFGYGIHGTIEPETIGQDVSLGCVRLAPDDIAAVYRMLVPGESLVTITD